MIYTGIGSRETPSHILQLMTSLARAFSDAGYYLRSGGAPGADSAFEEGASKSIIYLPWDGFNGRFVDGHTFVTIPSSSVKVLSDIASKYHPAWNKLSDTARKFHIRNVAQVLGINADKPSNLVICYTKNGAGTGGTGQAIRVAKAYNIPVYDLGFITPS